MQTCLIKFDQGVPVIVDSKTHDFDNCPTCKGMVILIPVGEDVGEIQATREANNRAQEKLCLEYMDAWGIAA